MEKIRELNLNKRIRKYNIIKNTLLFLALLFINFFFFIFYDKSIIHTDFYYTLFFLAIFNVIGYFLVEYIALSPLLILIDIQNNDIFLVNNKSIHIIKDETFICYRDFKKIIKNIKKNNELDSFDNNNVILLLKHNPDIDKDNFFNYELYDIDEWNIFHSKQKIDI